MARTLTQQLSTGSWKSFKYISAPARPLPSKLSLHLLKTAKESLKDRHCMLVNLDLERRQSLLLRLELNKTAAVIRSHLQDTSATIIADELNSYNSNISAMVHH